MFSLLTQRTLSRLGSVSLNLGRIYLVATKPTVSVRSQARRTFLTGTPHLSLATAEKTTAKKTTAAKKPAQKEKLAAEPTATKAKPRVKPKKKAAVKKRKVAAKPKAPTRPKINKADLPPRQSYNAYVIFYTKYIKGLDPQNKPKSLQDIVKLSKEASAEWKSFSEAEKQPFKDEAVAAREKYVIDRENYFANVSPSTLSEINRLRRKKGKSAIRPHKAEADRRPSGAFFLYLRDFRASSGVDIKSSSTDGRAATLEVARQAGKKWREMSDSDKAPYMKESNEAMAKYKAAHT